MKRFTPWLFLLALVAAAPAIARTSVNVDVSIGNAPPPPDVIWSREPRLAVLRTTGVWYYEGPCDYDYFRYGNYYYIYNSGYWYRASSYRGPFVTVRETYVPRVFYGLHDRGYAWRHQWMPPGQIGKEERREEREERHEHKHGHGLGHDQD